MSMQSSLGTARQRAKPNKTQSEMLAALIERAKARHEKYRHVVVETFPSLLDLEESTIIGSFSWLGLKSRTRYIQASTAINIGGYLQTPSDVARDYLAEKYGGKRRRVTTKQYHAIMEKRHHPLFAVAGRYDDALYVDIKAAYWSIVRIVGWDVDYNPNRWLGQGESMEDFPYAEHKLARNCLVTAGIYANQKIWNAEKKKLITVRRGNALTNYCLWALVQDVLNAVAFEAIGAGAVYCHTDGFIVERRNLTDLMSVIAEWGLTPGIKYEGPAEVYSAGAYSIGPKLNRRKMFVTRTMHSITYYADIDWLKPRFRRFALGE